MASRDRSHLLEETVLLLDFKPLDLLNDSFVSLLQLVCRFPLAMEVRAGSTRGKNEFFENQVTSRHDASCKITIS